VCEPDDRVVTTLVGHASTEAEDMRACCVLVVNTKLSRFSHPSDTAGCCRVIDLSHTIVSPMPSSFRCVVVSAEELGYCTNILIGTSALVEQRCRSPSSNCGVAVACGSSCVRSLLWMLL